MRVLAPLRRATWNVLRRASWAGRPATRYAGVYGLLPAVLSKTDSAVARRLLLLPAGEGGSQLNQDIFALLANQFQPGYFVEIGANDGFGISNTLYLEQHFCWRGLLVEANPRYLPSLRRRVGSSVVAKALAEAPGMFEFADAGVFGGIVGNLDKGHACHTALAPRIEVEADTVESVFTEAGVPSVIDFLSVDVEGGELPIMRQVVRGTRRIRCGCVEVNDRAGDRSALDRLLTDTGYEVVWRDMTESDVFFVDPALVRQSRILP